MTAELTLILAPLPLTVLLGFGFAAVGAAPSMIPSGHQVASGSTRVVRGINSVRSEAQSWAAAGGRASGRSTAGRAAWMPLSTPQPAAAGTPQPAAAGVPPAMPPPRPSPLWTPPPPRPSPLWTPAWRSSERPTVGGRPYQPGTGGPVGRRAHQAPQDGC